MKQKIGLNIYHKLEFKKMNSKNTFENFIKKKIYPLDQLNEISVNKTKNNKKIILCHGTFDLFMQGILDIFKIQKI